MKPDKIWIDTRLSEECMQKLREYISNTPPYGDTCNKFLAGNISKSELIVDKDNWFYDTTLKSLIEKIFYGDWNNYYWYHIKKEEPLPKFNLETFWVNYQKQHEFNPLHNHGGLFSFVVFMKIPTDAKEQYNLPFSKHSNSPDASDFQFVWSENDEMKDENISLSSEDEGRMLFFPATLHHQVYPFYECEEDRITISGNIIMESEEEETWWQKKKRIVDEGKSIDRHISYKKL